MGLFWIIVGVLVIAALIFVLPPLLGRRIDPGPSRRELGRVLYEQRLAELERDVNNDVLTRAQYKRARRDLERELLADSADDTDPAGRSQRERTPWAGWLVGIALPALAIGFYVQFSTGFHALDGAPGNVASSDGERGQPMMEEMVAAIEARLAQHPEDRTGWIMLARANTLSGHYEEASQAYARADRLADLDDAGTLVAYAQTLAFAKGQQFAGRPTALLGRALELEPDNAHALWLAGWANFQREDFAEAVNFWERLEKVIPVESRASFGDLPEYIAEAKRLARQTPAAGSAQVVAPDRAAVSDSNPDGETASDHDGQSTRSSLRVSVQLAPSLADRVSPEDILFIYAQAVEGARMPLALARRTAADLPLEVSLDDSMAMASEYTVSSEDRVVVTARISESGQALPQSGDLMGESKPVSTDGRTQVSITIDRIVP